jgi:hypothetical protein
MARKKQEIALQAEIETQEEWEDMLSKEGLTGTGLLFFRPGILFFRNFFFI